MNMLTAAAKGQRLEYIYDVAANDDELNAFAPTIDTSIDLDSFVSGACEFFATEAKQSATVGTPYIAKIEQLASLEFTAAIRITGKVRGSIYLSASRAMLTIMLMRMGATDITVATMSNALHKLAATMVGVARHNNGDDVLVWEPSIATERSGKIESRGAPLVVPIHWRKFTAQLVMCVE
jgi:chemotaxis protein CheX